MPQPDQPKAGGSEKEALINSCFVNFAMILLIGLRDIEKDGTKSRLFSSRAFTDCKYGSEPPA